MTPPRRASADQRRVESDRPHSRGRRRPAELAQPTVSTADGARRRPADAWLVYFTVAAVMSGMLMVFSAIFPKSDRLLIDMLMQLIYSVVGIVIMFAISAIHPEIIRRYSMPAFILAIVATAWTLTHGPFTHTSHGATLWLKIGPFTAQPSEFAKLAFIVYVSSQLAIGPLNRKTLWNVGLNIIIATGAYAGVLVLQRDQGMATLVVMIALAMTFLGNLRTIYLALVIAVCTILGTIATLAEDYRVTRLKAFIDPLGHRHEGGWHILTMETTIAHGGLLGVGLAQCPEKWGAMPEAHTDAIFCVLASECGLVGALAFLALMVALIVRCAQIAREASDNTGYFMASGIAAMFALQALINLGAATHLLPITGLTLPFLSDGGSSLITCLAAIGVVMSVYRHPFQRVTGAQK